MTPNFRLLILICSCCLALTACGLKGDLYLPDSDSPEARQSEASQAK